jgi:uncharacterized membrane protein
MVKQMVRPGLVSRRNVAEEIRVRCIPADAPWRWLSAGWRDLWTVPHISLAYGAVFAVLALALAVGLLQFGLQSLMLALCGGFLLIGPLVAVGLYETSRRLETGEPLTLAEVASAGRNAPIQLALFGTILALAYAIWLQLAFLLFTLFIGDRDLPPTSEFGPMLLFTSQGLGLLVVGTTVGGVIAAFVFTISAISVPLLMTRRLDAITAMGTSAEAVVLNPKPMALWAVLVAAFMAFGIATFFVGFVLAFPLIGHATWHAFRNLVEGRTPRDLGH